MKKKREMFTYSNVVRGEELREYDLKQAPIFVQEFLEPKIDCRITYVKEKIFSVKILKDKVGIYGDWRFHKEQLDYVTFELPDNVKYSICRLMDNLKLNFGGIDLAFVDDDYYFIEVNPTGEWGWLEVKTGMEISKAIEEALYKE